MGKNEKKAYWATIEKKKEMANRNITNKKIAKIANRKKRTTVNKMKEKINEEKSKKENGNVKRNAIKK